MLASAGSQTIGPPAPSPPKALWIVSSEQKEIEELGLVGFITYGSGYCHQYFHDYCFPAFLSEPLRTLFQF